MKRYTGRRVIRGSREHRVPLVTVYDDERNETYRLPHVLKHSPDGFEWGYSGSGPSDLAISILSDVFDKDPEPSLYQDFRDEFIAQFQSDWSLTEREIRHWVQLRAKEKSDAAETV